MRRNLVGASLLAVAASLGAGGVAQAQTTGDEATALGAVVVTGSRIVRDGFSAPTPTTVMSQQDIQRTALPNIADVVNLLPQLQGSVTPATGNRAISAGAGGGNNLNLRSLGANRTLVLMDGRRIVPTSGSGVTDINNVPSQLIQRVDVVTGGASAAYGSDAVTGVVNFVLDKNYTGLKGQVQGGISSRKDNAQYGGNLTYGGRFLDGRLHLLLSGDVQINEGVPILDRNKRSWYRGIRQLPNPAFVSRTATPNVPALITRENVNSALSAPGGLITAGPLKGTQFGPGGTVLPFTYGSPVVGQVMAGGQLGDITDSIAFVTPVDAANVFGRLAYDINDTTSIFAQFVGGYSKAEGNGSPRARFLGNLTMRVENPYLPASVATALRNAGQTTFSFGTNSNDLGWFQQRNIRDTRQTTVGINGKIFGEWSWDAYYQHGRSDLKFQLGNNLLRQNYLNAIDVISGPNGQPVCRSFATQPTCVPLNAFGTGVASAAALPYFTGTSQTNIRYVQEVAEASVSGTLVDLWAGPVAVVAGLGWRKESIRTPFVDELSLQDRWFTANYKPTAGSYNVKEVFAETVIPLAKDMAIAKSLEFNGAVRVTDYSTSGTVATWKGGLNYRPVQDLLLRGTRSRDIRAPNLNELYQGGSIQQQPNALDPKYGNQLISSFPNAQSGNPNLTPEKSNQLGLGAVYQPSWFSGFSVSVDYYDVKLKRGIGNVPFQNFINECFLGIRPDYCPFITRGPGFVGGVSVPDTIVAMKTVPVNLAAFRASGYDIEASYRKNLSDWVDNWNGAIDLRTLATHVTRNTQDNGVGVVHERAGEVTSNSSSPDWRLNTQFTYLQGGFSLSVNWRWISSGVMSTSFYDTAGGPLTIDMNDVPSVSYFDLGATYRFMVGGRSLEVYGRVQNLFDKDPPVIGTTNLFDQQYNPFLYDGVGRYFRAGMRFAF